MEQQQTYEKVTTLTIYIDDWPEPRRGEGAFRRELRDLLASHGMWSDYALIEIKNEKVTGGLFRR